MLQRKTKYYQEIQGNHTVLQDERSIQIMQKARNFNIEIFENELLASELFNLNLENSFDKEAFENFLGVFILCEKAIQRAQMSS
ncbi:MAG TPA: hypothetical protein CFH82_00870 [Sulfurospirillum sp. UBA12182]|nr:MAG TPA: hypothetical protein CFH82_00870 [Sulfurospirillum sp. UBA12182]